MGLYLEPEIDKQEWIEENGKKGFVDFEDIPNNKVLICVVDNGFFVAMAVAFSEREVKAFSLPDDHRPKEWYLVNKEVVKPIAPQWDRYIKE